MGNENASSGGKQVYFGDFERSLSSIHCLACSTMCFSASFFVGNMLLPLDDDIMEAEFFSKLNVGSRCPSASAFILINCG